MKSLISKGVFLCATVFLTLLFISSGCAIWNYPPPSTRPHGPFYFDASYDEVWEAAVETVTELGFGITAMSRVDGFFYNRKKSDRNKQTHH